MKKIIVLITLLWATAATAYAADVSLVAPSVVKNGEQFIVSVDVQTGGELINSADVSFSYPTNLFVFKGYKEEGSLMKLWIAPPSNINGTVHFSGIIPGGVDGIYDPEKTTLSALPLAKFIFTARTPGEGTFITTHSDILKNDGRGTALVHEEKSKLVTVLDVDANTHKTGELDTIPPEEFDIQLIPAGFFSRTPSMLIFSTVDRGSGVEKYQLLKRSEWVTVLSPLPIHKNIFSRTYVIEAVDYAGNSRSTDIIVRGFITGKMIVIGIILIFLCLFGFYMVKKK